MKTLILARHSKTNRDNWAGSDIERPLLERGVKDSKDMGKKMVERAIKPDLILSSPAKRAMHTAQLLASELGIDENTIVSNKDIYEAAAAKLQKAINQIDNKYNAVLLVGHNPSLSIVVSELTGDKIGDVPTCGICVVELEADEWKEVSRGTGTLKSFDYPKNG